MSRMVREYSAQHATRARAHAARLTTIRDATRIAVIEDGRITETGTHTELMALRGHYHELYRQQSLQESTQSLAAVPWMS